MIHSDTVKSITNKKKSTIDENNYSNNTDIEQKMINNILNLENLLKNNGFLIDAHRDLIIDRKEYVQKLFKEIMDQYDKYKEEKSNDIMINILQNCSMIEDYYQTMICLKKLRNENTDFLSIKLWHIKRTIEVFESEPNIVIKLKGLKKKNLETAKYISLLQKTYNELNIDNADEHISELLSSVYSPQRNRYIMGEYNGYLFPIDYQLYNIIHKIIMDGYIPIGWDYREDKKCFFSIGGYKENRNFRQIREQLIELFGKENINKKKEKDDEKITIYIYNGKNKLPEFIGISFSHTLISKIEEILQTPKNDHIILPGKAEVERICKIDNHELTRITRKMYHKNMNNKDIFG